MSADSEVTAFQERLAALEAEIVKISSSKESLEQYYRLFLEHTVAVLGVGGAIWRYQSGQLKSSCHLNLAVAGLETNGRQSELLNNALQRVAQSGSPVVMPGNAGANLYDQGVSDVVSNDSPHTLLFVPIYDCEQVTAIVLLISPPEVDPRAVRGYLGFIQGLCGRAGVFVERYRIRQQESQLSRSDRLREYVSALHSNLDPRRTCFALANYGQELLGVYRCLVGTFSSGGKFRMESVSGLESVAIKSNLIRGISEVARQVCKNDKVLLVDNPNAALSASSEQAHDLLSQARLYMLQADSQYLGVFPIRSGGQVVGALVVEKAVEEPIDQEQSLQIEAMLVEAGTALANSMSYRNLPFSPFIRAIASVRDRLYRMNWARRGIWAVIILLICLLPFVIKREVKVIGAAELVPYNARTAYADQDGVIQSLSIPEGRKVLEGDVLASLDTRIIDKEIDTVGNQIDEAPFGLGL